MAKTRQPRAERSPERASQAALIRYRVHYIVTRGEIYEIEALNQEIAYDEAFINGDFVEATITTNLVDYEIEEVAP